MKGPRFKDKGDAVIGFDLVDCRSDEAAFIEMTHINGIYTVTKCLRGAEAVAEAEKHQPKSIDLKVIQSLIGKYPCRCRIKKTT